MTKIAYVTNAPPHSGMGRPAHAMRAELMHKSHLEIDELFIDGSAGELRQNGHVLKSATRLPGPLNSKPFTWWRLAGALPRHTPCHAPYLCLALHQKDSSGNISGTQSQNFCCSECRQRTFQTSA
jgi:hypothetical protein